MRWTKSKFLNPVFSTFLKVSGTFGVDLELEWQREVVCKLFEPLCFAFLGAGPISYVKEYFEGSLVRVSLVPSFARRKFLYSFASII